MAEIPRTQTPIHEEKTEIKELVDTVIQLCKDKIERAKQMGKSDCTIPALKKKWL